MAYSVRQSALALALCCAFVSSVHAQTTNDTVLPAFGRQFERNVGQAPPEAQFVAREPGYALLLTREAAVVRTPAQRDVRIVFAGGDMRSVEGEASTPTVVNYLLGNDRSKWHTNIGVFERVRYHDVYPGIDVVYHSSHGLMEYDVALDPGADPKQVRIRVEGAERVSLEKNGDLLIHLEGGVLTMRKPALYQEAGGERRSVEGNFVARENGDIGFDVGAYDSQASLVIDPVLEYSSLLPVRSDGSSNSPHMPAAIVVDAAGAMYILGTVSIPFAGFGQSDLFVTKVNPSGSSVAFTTYLGGSLSETARALALGPAGEIHLVGQTGSYDFPAVAAAQPVYLGQTDAFLAKLSAAGDVLEYSTFVGTVQQDIVEGLAVDAEANAYIAGTRKFALFPSDVIGGGDGFVAKYDQFGTRVFHLPFAWSGNDEVHAAHLAPDGALIVAGETTSPDFPVTAGAFMTTPSPGDGFVTRIRTLDGLILQSTFLGGNSSDEIRAIATDPTGAVYLTGETLSSNFPTTAGTIQPAYGGGVNLYNAFVTKLTPTLSGLLYSTYLGGSDFDSASWISVDAAGQAVVAGSAPSANFPIFAPLMTTLNAAFVAKLSSNGGQFVYSTRFPAAITGMTIGPTGDVYITGSASGFSLDPPYPTTADALVPFLSSSVSTRGVFARIGDGSPPCSFALPSSVHVVAGSSASHSLNVIAPGECFWTAASSDIWLVPTTTSGIGTGIVTFTVASLTSGTRSATLTVGNGTTERTVTVYQAACSISASNPTTQPAAGATTVITLTGSAGCPFTTRTDASWISAAPAFDVLDGAGQAQVTLTIAPNPNFRSRTSNVQLGTSAFRQIQQAAACTASLSPSGFTPHRLGATTPVTVTVAPADCQWTARADVPWLVPSVSSAVGSGTIGLTALPNTGGSRTGHVEIAGQAFGNVFQSGPLASSTPYVYAPSPAAGTGYTQTFTFTFVDTNGAGTLDVVNVLINNFLDGASACYLAYARSINVLYLVNDAGDGLLPGMVLNGGDETLANSQCQIGGQGSSAAIAGNVLTLKLNISFAAEFAGNKVVYQAARNVTGFNSGWAQQGVWNVPGAAPSQVAVLPMAPERGASSAQLFEFTFSDLAGVDQLVSTTVLINGYLDGFRACYLGYHVPTNSVLLLNDAGNAYIAGVTLGTNVTVENSQCRIKALTSGAVTNGTDLTLSLMIEFKAGFAGDRVIYASAQDGSGTSGWQALGSWTVP